MRKDIKERIELIREGKVPEGYKKTKLGIIPQNWQCVRLKDMAEISSGSTPSRKSKENFKGEILWVTSGELKNKYLFMTNEMISKQAVVDNGLRLYEPGTVVIAIYGLEADGIRGTCSIIAKECTISQACMAFTDFKEIDKEYFYYWYQSNGNRIGLKYAQGTKQQNLCSDLIGKISIAFPPIYEQKHILKYLGTFDKIIEKVQAIIDLKQKQKYWLIQNLLTGKKRLSGHYDTWKKEKLKIFLEEMTEKNKSALVSNIKSISNKRGFVNQSKQFGKKVASNDLSNYKIVKNGYIAYNPSRINVGSIALYHGETQGVISPMYVVLKTKNGLNEKYFMYYVRTTLFNQYMKSQLLGSVRETLKFDDLCAIKINFPSYDEQKEIVKVLEMADIEIKLLEQKLELLKQEKKAMMQLLLTGIVQVSEE